MLDPIYRNHVTLTPWEKFLGYTLMLFFFLVFVPVGLLYFLFIF